MNSYTIQSKTFNKNRVFILQKSELEKRFDPLYYAHVFNEYEKKLINKPFKKFHQILKSINNGYDFREYKDSGTPYLKVANVKQGELDFTKIQYIDFNSSEISKNIQLKKGNLLLTRKGTFGNAFALDADYDFVISSEVFYLELNGNSILPKFLEIFFNSIIGQAQFDKHKIGAIMGSLSQEAIRELKIPFPSLEIQKHIISIYNNYIEKKKKNEGEAEKLLASIDYYLLGELGIKIPEPPENTLKNRMFTRTLKEIASSRFDPFYHQKYFDAFKNPSSKYPSKRIKEICSEMKTGLPVRKDYRIVGGVYPYYGANGVIGYMDEYTHDGTYLVVGQDGYIGNHYIVNGKFWGSNHNWVVKLKPDNDYHFIKAALDLMKYDYLITGGVIPKLTKESLESIRIPIPPLEKQKEIADHISAIRQQAQQLKDKTKAILEQANKEIDKILLG